MSHLPVKLALAGFFFSACAELPPGPPGGAGLTLEPPQLACPEVRCEEDLWEVEVRASHWTGGVTLEWTVDGHYVEVHPLRAWSADPAGGLELLSLDLGAVADWRAVVPGSTTAFLCGDAPTWRLVALDLGGAVTSCADPEPARWAAVEGATVCPEETLALCRPASPPN